MAEFYKLHQRQDLVLCTQGSVNFVGLILGYHEDSYAVLPIYTIQGEPQREVLSLHEENLLQKVGSLDFDALNGADSDFQFGDWVEIDEF